MANQNTNWVKFFENYDYEKDRKERAQKREKERQDRIKQRRKEHQKMSYTPKERQAYLKALRYGRRQKAGGTYKAVPGVKFNGGSLAVGKDKKGNVHVFSNNRESYKVTELGPRGMRKATDWSYLSLADQKKASKIISSIFAGVSKGKYKLGSTGSRGG